MDKKDFVTYMLRRMARLEARVKELEVRPRSVSERTMEKDAPVSSGQVLSEWLNGEEQA